MKKLINAVDDVVADELKGIELAHPDLVRVDHENAVIYRADAPVKGKVALISGGGSGHEPMHGGFVGKGMLDAACAGPVFTSPTPDQMVAATKAVASEAGVLYIVKNYTGDVMNFEMAAEMVAMEDESIRIETVVIDDDCAVQDSTWTAGRRGVGLTVLLEKIVGAAAEAGQDLDSCLALAKKLNAQGRSYGMALDACTTPAAGQKSFELADDEMELGVGIHGEPGRETAKIMDAHGIAEHMVKAVTDDYDFSDEDVIVMVNGMGATPLIELYLMYGEIAQMLADKGIKIARNLVGNYITSLDMAGCSLTILKADEEILRLWDAPVLTAGLRKGI